jgi:TIR domain
MAYTSYKYDVFISYARADDIKDDADKGWVEQLYEKLRDLLPQRLAGNEAVIFFDREKVKSNDQLDRLQSAAQSSAVFLAVVSDAYAARDWTRRELDAFISHNEWQTADQTRLFAIECLEPSNRAALPVPLNTHIGKPFWKKIGGAPMPLEPGEQDYRACLVSLAVDIAETLKAIRDAGEKKAPAPSPAKGPRVLLAQTTEDLDDARAKLQSYLAQFDIAVLPEMEYPQGGKEFSAAFLEDLAQASLFVQLLSGSPGRHPRDLLEGYSRFQFNAAKAKGVPIMQWHSPELQVTADSIADEEHRKLLGGEDVIVETLESFKERVKKKATEKPPAPAPAARGDLSSYVFIDADQEDLAVAGQIADELCRESLASGVPVLEGAPEDVQESVEGGILQCDVLALVYGQSSAQWVDRHWLKYIKLRRRREAPPRALIEIWLVPPEKTLSPGTRLPEGIKRVQITGPVSRENLRPLIEALAQ